ncbi:neocarzinostatin apoprotein domain-containing protein [Yinghuangia sp. YIM S10712]|uniref:neocarzinostatin apoprotein domain-containing protein n=1 Tax=Yinghuangia sp. YIM S10712 TaxID=3436930 RepID=UPI003F53AEB2
MTTLRTRRGTAAGALAVLSLLLAWLVTGAAPAHAATAAITVSKSTGLNPDGELVTVTGTGFVPGISLFVTVCDPGKPAGAACDGLNYKIAPVDAAGNFTVEVKAAAKFGNTDCLTTPCAFQTSRVGMGKDRTQEASAAINFTGGVPASLPTKPQENAGPPGGVTTMPSVATDTATVGPEAAGGEGAQDDDGDGSSTGIIIGVVAGVVVVGGGAAFLVVRRRSAA